MVEAAKIVLFGGGAYCSVEKSTHHKNKVPSVLTTIMPFKKG